MKNIFIIISMTILLSRTALHASFDRPEQKEYDMNDGTTWVVFISGDWFVGKYYQNPNDPCYFGFKQQTYELLKPSQAEEIWDYFDKSHAQEHQVNFPAPRKVYTVARRPSFSSN